MSEEEPALTLETEKSSDLARTPEALAQQLLTVTAEIEPRSLQPQIEGCEKFLRLAQRAFARRVADRSATLSAAGEWLLDNYYLVQRVLRQVENDLPETYFRQLPRLARGPLAGLPRVYVLARGVLEIAELRISMPELVTFVRRFQETTPLTMGEVWALPTMVRIHLLAALARNAGEALSSAPPDVVTANAANVSGFSTAEQSARIFNGLREVDNANWEQFFEAVALVEAILNRDPADVFQRMTFAARDRYRGVVEEVAQRAADTETEVARRAVEMAQAGTGAPRDHVGFYLVGPGRIELEAKVGYQPVLTQRFRRLIRRHGALFYLGGIGTITALLLTLLLAFAIAAGGTPLQLTAAGALGLLPASALAVTGVNWLLSTILPPARLPRLDYSDGIPAGHRTLVVIPALLSSDGEVDSLLAQLERHYLRNVDPQLTFALLSDFTDAPEKEMPEDAALLARARIGIRRLNQRYEEAPFLLLHRERLWNPAEEQWMGWERKRGKLEELNRLLRGEGPTSYVIPAGSAASLSDVQYVITLDADTVLPHGAAQRLVGTLAHPLNAPRFDAETGRLSAGHAILQPRTEIQPTSAARTWFAHIFSGGSGIDLYSHAASDVYQDLFGSGIYVGKGIYHVDGFRRALKNRVPENQLLSHDLFEGIFGRAALVTDVVLYEDFPADYLGYARRLHRWVRGDWQLLPWLLPTVPTRDGGRVRNPIGAINLWKVTDNLRRALVGPATLALLIAGWLWLPGAAWVWTVLGGLVPAGILFSHLATRLLRTTTEAETGSAHHIRRYLLRWLVLLVMLPYEALLVLHAILTVLVRLRTRRHLLQWTTMAQTRRVVDRNNPRRSTWREMWTAPLTGAAVGVLLPLMRPAALLPAGPFLLAWILAPRVALWLGRPTSPPHVSLTGQQRRELRVLARRTWLYFEEFIGPEDHWLPPDHFQESPRGTVAHRTSPTNIGLALLSTLAACDFGYIGIWELTRRLIDTLDGVERLEKYQGHLLNWYDTRTLETLPPRYVSTVDSGNLAGALLALRQGCREKKEKLVPRRVRWRGLLDTLDVLREIVTDHDSPENPRRIELEEAIDQVRQRLLAQEKHPHRWTNTLRELQQKQWPEVEKKLLALLASKSPSADVVQQLRTWSGRINYHLNSMSRRLENLLPWLTAGVDAPPYLKEEQGDETVIAAWRQLQAAIPRRVQVKELPETARRVRRHVQDVLEVLPATTDGVAAARQWCADLISRLEKAERTASALTADYDQIIDRCTTLIEQMNFRFLYDRQRHIFHIGYNVDAEETDPNYYDLLASEARIASLIAIARRDVPDKHWLHLGRPLTAVDDGRLLLSWSGTMFEYLMPILLTRQYEGTLLSGSTETAVKAQMAYGREKKVPWGISESGYHRFDANLNYQYQAFGVPGTGLKRDLGRDLVVAPYASLLALPLDGPAVMENLARMRGLGLVGAYGLYEAIDYTPSRLGLGQEHAIVRSYMVHHQGMILLSLLNALQEDRLVERFHADPLIQSVELLLQEEIPPRAPLESPLTEEQPAATEVPEPEIVAAPWSVPVNAPAPQVHYLSNGTFGTLITNAGGGFSRWKEIDLTRWRADTTMDEWGTWIYFENLKKETVQSMGAQPAGAPLEKQSVTFAPHKADFHLSNTDVSAHMELTVPPVDDLEIRRIRLTNHTSAPQKIRLTSYAEIVLAAQEGDRRHPAFNKLFIESEFLTDLDALLFTRRPRDSRETPPFMGHMVVAGEEQEGATRFESNRVRFLGRGGSLAAPRALSEGGGRSDAGETGPVLDPIMSLSRTIDLAAHATADVIFVTAAGASRQDVVQMLHKYRAPAATDLGFKEARRQNITDLQQLDLDGDQLRNVQLLLGRLFYPHQALRAAAERLAANRRGQEDLWPHAISGDYPILLVRVHDEESLPLVHQAVQAHIYWRRRGLKIDLVLLNEKESGYNQALQGQLHRLLYRLESDQWIHRRGGIFVIQADGLAPETHTLLLTAARVILDGQEGPLAAQLSKLEQAPSEVPAFVPPRGGLPLHETAGLERPTDLRFDNGWGGFSPDGREYVVYLRPGETTPAPWINVIANPEAGFTISTAGDGYTWAANSGENRLTPWRNDPVRERPGEALYLRDEESAHVWSPTPAPAGADTPTLIRHGAGYTTFHSRSHGLEQRLRLFMLPDEPVKIIQLQLENQWDRPRRLTATYYAEWVLGVHRDAMQQYIVPEYDDDHQALLAFNRYNGEFARRCAFLAACRPAHGLTTSRTEFLGRLGRMQQPAALERLGLSGTVRAGHDPCAALQVHVDLAPGDSTTVTFLLGQGDDVEHARRLLHRYRQPPQIETGWEKALEQWERLLGTVTVDTPDEALNVMLNRWLPYQNLSCRIWGRSGFYQSSGAYGFRDQLQDVMGILHMAPELAREHILRAAAHQFTAGDVLHWWHPPSGRGVRTRIRDDLLWLPYVTAHYVQTTGDTEILREEIPFRRGDPLGPDEEERYAQYAVSDETATLYEHCRRALERGDTRGPHGLPLMGDGDWNDGMNRVGHEGRGESIWLGWFLYATLDACRGLAREMGDGAQAEEWATRMSELRRALDENAWDGEWYLRAFFDDGTPLGSAENEECQIDAIAQSWATLSGAGNEERARRALDAVDRRLVREEDQLLLLFTPPFDRTPHDPGYIKGYPPGIRENGGQYTHAAVWTAWAHAAAGNGERAAELFDLLNPVHHADTAEGAARYQVEPYVTAADIYSRQPHTGRGGWTWYTGSGGWLYRLGVEALLGIRRQGAALRVIPHIHSSWDRYHLRYRYGNSTYFIAVSNPDHVSQGEVEVTIDGKEQPENYIPLVDDGREHHVQIRLWAPRSAASNA